MVKKQPNYKYHVLFAVSMGFIIVFVTHLAKGQLALVDTSKTESTLKSTFEGDSVERAFVGWGIIALVLFSASSFDSTASLAAAFAWLILISVILLNGQTLLKISGNYTNNNSERKGGK